MKKSMIYLLSLAFIFALSSCGGESSEESEKEKEKSPQERLDGTWEIIEAEGQMAEMNKGTQYIFDGTSRFTTKKGIIENKGDITDISDSHYKVIFDNMETEYTFKYKFEGDKLIIEAGTEGQVFTLERK